MRCAIGLFLACFLLSASPARAEEDYIKIEVRGVVVNPNLYPGAYVMVKREWYPLDFLEYLRGKPAGVETKRERELERKEAMRYDNKEVLIRGTLRHEYKDGHPFGLPVIVVREIYLVPKSEKNSKK